MRQSRGIDYVILAIICILVIFGLVVLSSASSDLGKSRFDDPLYYLQHQFLYGFLLGVIGFIVGLFIPYENYKKIAPFLLGVSLLAVALTFTPLGVSLGGASRWINLGPFTFQPAELLKFTFIIYLAAWLSGGKLNRQADFSRGFMIFAIISGFVALLLLLQKSTSSMVIIMAATLAVYFASGARLKYIFYIMGGGAILMALFIAMTPYRLQRVLTYFNPQSDSTGAGYQINQALITIGSGGITGVGYGKSTSKAYLPERIGDSIFAIIAEEFGFIGAISVITMFLFIVLRSYINAKNVRDMFGKLILIGFATIIGVQAFMHIASISGLIPLTGVPLPFISYGGTALAVFMTATGVMLNITKRA